MRFGFLLMFVLLVSPLCADDAATAIVTKALKATGWDQRKDNATWKDAGKFTLGGVSMDFNGDFHVAYPDKYRFGMAMKVGGNDFQLTVVLNGDQAWEAGMGKTEEIKGDKLTYLKTELYQMRVLSLKPLVDPKAGFTLATTGEATVENRKCLGISASKADKPVIKLWFDAESGLPAKLECKVKNEFDGWKEATDEMYLSDWADDAGQKTFRKVRIDRNGKLLIESVLSDYKEPEKVDPKVFEKP